jgi:alkylation response protein AidB-like acyl-CoA dehydrogenase
MLARTRRLPAAVALGAGTRAREYAHAYAAQRIAFGRPILDFQGVAFPLVDAAMQLDAAWLGLLDLATRIDNSDPDAPKEVSAMINECHAAATAATREGIQTLGGHGFLADHPVERWYRCTALLSTLDSDPFYAPFHPAV